MFPTTSPGTKHLPWQSQETSLPYSSLPITGLIPFSSTIDVFLLNGNWHGIWQLLSFIFKFEQLIFSLNPKIPGKGSNWLSICPVLPLELEAKAEVEQLRSVVVQLVQFKEQRVVFPWNGWRVGGLGDTVWLRHLIFNILLFSKIHLKDNIKH